MLRPARPATCAVAQQVSLHLEGGGACAEASHHRHQVLRVNLSITPAVVETETLLKLWLDTHTHIQIFENPLDFGFFTTDWKLDCWPDDANMVGGTGLLRHNYKVTPTNNCGINQQIVISAELNMTYKRGLKAPVWRIQHHLVVRNENCKQC